VLSLFYRGARFAAKTVGIPSREGSEKLREDEGRC
jgi:hypothetical protein